MNSLKNRGIKDILILCADGLTGLKVRNTIKYVATKDKKIFAADLKKIYTAQDEPTAARIRDEVELKWSKKISARNEIVANELGCYCSYFQVLADSSHDCLHNQRD